jgi:WD40 repeat protein
MSKESTTPSLRKLPASELKTGRARRWLPALFVALISAVLAAVVIQQAGRGNPPLQTWELGKKVTAVAFSPNGEALAVGLALTGHKSEITALAFSPDGRLLASGDRAEVYLWNASSGAVANDAGDYTGGGEALAFSPDGRLFASGGNDGKIRIRSTTDGRSLRLLQGHKPTEYRGYGREYGVISVAFTSDSRKLSAGNFDNIVQQWDIYGGQATSTQRGYNPGDSGYSPPMRSLAFSPRLRVFATTFEGSTKAYIWRQRQIDWDSDGQSDGMSDSELVSEWEGNLGDIWSLAFAPDGELVASGGGKRGGDYADAPHFDDMSIYIWSAADGGERARLRGHTGNVRSLAWRSDGRLLASGSDDGTVRLWEVR